MNIKTFRAADLNEALGLVYEEFGEDARVMHTRQVDEPRLFGLLRRRFVEITAAKPEATVTPVAAASPLPPRSRSEPGDDFVRQLLDSPYETVPPPRESGPLRTEIPETPPEFTHVPTGNWRCYGIEQLNPTVLQRNLLARFEESVRFGGPLDLSGDRPRVVALVGPTGVGKTSLLAKLAAHCRLKEFKRVGFLTVDLFRLGAIEQLRKYAETLDVPLEIVSEMYRVKSALARLKDCRLILLDTPGTNPKNRAKLQMLGSLLDAASVDEVHLLLSATSSAAVLEDALRRFKPLGLTGLDFTKMDEGVGLGDIYRFLKDNELPLRYFSTGQNIMEDLEVAGPARLAALA